LLVGIIQLWRRVTDSTLIDECTDDIVIDNTTVKGTSGICFERARSRKCISTMLIIKITTVRERERKKRDVCHKSKRSLLLSTNFSFLYRHRNDDNIQ